MLDLATGEGKVSREMARRGAAHVDAVDESEAQLEIARARRNGLAINYFRGHVGNLGSIGKYDIITAGWCLHYAEREKQLHRMVRDIAWNLDENGVFVALNNNPYGPLGGTEGHGYIITSEHQPLRSGGRLKVQVFGNGRVEEFYTFYWDMKTYQRAFEMAGLTLEVAVPKPTEEGMQKMGAAYWEELERHPTSVIFQARHRS